MKKLLKSMVPQAIKDSFMGAIYRTIRPKNSTASSVNKPEYNPSASSVSHRETDGDGRNEAASNEGEELEEFEVDVRPRQLQAWLDDHQEFDILDIREPFELQQGHLAKSIFVPMNDVPNEYHHLSTTKPVVVVCAAGMRSWSVAQYLRNQGMDNVWSLENGWAAWSDHGHVSPHRGRFAVGTKVSVSEDSLRELDAEPSVEYGYIHNCELVDGEVRYAVQFWGAEGVLIASNIPESDIKPAS